MSTTFRFVDQAERTARPKWLEVTDSETLANILRLNTIKNKDTREDIVAAVACLKTLRPHQHGSYTTYCIGGAEDFTTAKKVRDGEHVIEEHQLRSTWTNVDEVIAAVKLLNDFYKSHRSRKTILDLPLKRVRRLMQKLDSGLVRLEEVKAVNEFARSEAYALYAAFSPSYLKDSSVTTEGYLGYGGLSLVPLARARMFDSEAAVDKFLRTTGKYLMRTLPAVQVVKIQLNMMELRHSVQGLGAKETDRLSDSRLQEAVSTVQREVIEQALQEVSRERLVERIDELDQVATLKRKM